MIEKIISFHKAVEWKLDLTISKRHQQFETWVFKQLLSVTEVKFYLFISNFLILITIIVFFSFRDKDIFKPNFIEFLNIDSSEEGGIST